MLREFFDITKDSGELFEGLKISQTAYMQELNSRPIIFLSFKDCKKSKLSSLLCIIDVLLQAVDRLPKDISPEESDAVRLQQIRKILLEQDIEKVDYLGRTIYLLSKCLYQYYHKKVVILIDEYDTPMISAYEQGYYEEIHDFFSSLYGSALKDNPYLERAMLTGIHRIAKENIFSGLNNLDVCTVMDDQYSQYFGLMPEETEALLAYYDLPLDEAVQAMLHANQDVREDFELLLSDGAVRVPVDLQTSFFELEQSATLWGLFLNSGYLTAAETQEDNEFQTAVCIPNQEVMECLSYAVFGNVCLFEQQL